MSISIVGRRLVGRCSLLAIHPFTNINLSIVVASPAAASQTLSNFKQNLSQNAAFLSLETKLNHFGLWTEKKH